MVGKQVRLTLAVKSAGVKVAVVGQRCGLELALAVELAVAPATNVLGAVLGIGGFSDNLRSERGQARAKKAPAEKQFAQGLKAECWSKEELDGGADTLDSESRSMQNPAHPHATAREASAEPATINQQQQQLRQCSSRFE